MTSTETNPGETQHGIKRTLGGSFTLAVTVGGVIGLGILRTPGEVACVVPDPVTKTGLDAWGLVVATIIFTYDG